MNLRPVASTFIQCLEPTFVYWGSFTTCVFVLLMPTFDLLSQHTGMRSPHPYWRGRLCVSFADHELFTYLLSAPPRGSDSTQSPWIILDYKHCNGHASQSGFPILKKLCPSKGMILTNWDYPEISRQSFAGQNKPRHLLVPSLSWSHSCYATWSQKRWRLFAEPSSWGQYHQACRKLTLWRYADGIGNNLNPRQLYLEALSRWVDWLNALAHLLPLQGNSYTLKLIVTVHFCSLF